MIRLAMMAVSLVAATMASPSDAENAQTAPLNDKTCMSVEDCLIALQAEHAINGGGGYAERFETFGAPAVAPLMELILKGDGRVSALAAQAAWLLPAIDSSYLPALMVRDREGNPSAFINQGQGWLANVIGRVGTDEALDYLFEVMAAHSERGMHNGAGAAIQRFGRERYLLWVRRELEHFPDDGSSDYLSVLVDMANGPYPFDPEPMPSWVEPALVRIANAPSINKRARTGARYFLKRLRSHVVRGTAEPLA